jgi:hypothetical protein
VEARVASCIQRAPPAGQLKTLRPSRIGPGRPTWRTRFLALGDLLATWATPLCPRFGFCGARCLAIYCSVRGRLASS